MNNSTTTLRLGSVTEAHSVFEAHTASIQRVANRSFELIADFGGKTVDVGWLPSASEALQISADIRDYVLVDVPIVRLDVPNRNMDAFPHDEATRWKIAHGRITYRTFVGKPSCLNHQNKVADNPAFAKGVIFDAHLDHDQRTIRILMGYDRSKDAKLAEAILKRQRTGFSMGALVGVAQCSIPGCGKRGGRAYCTHTQPTAKGKLFSSDGRLWDSNRAGGFIAYEQCYDVNWIEASSVDDPADVKAHGKQIW